MARPNITTEELRQLLPMVQQIEEVIPGGQKAVFPCVLDGKRCAIKVLECARDDEDGDSTVGRVQREVMILGDCSSDHLPRLGPIGLAMFPQDDRILIVFSEEWIDGETLAAMIAQGPLEPATVIRLATQMTAAIAEMWRLHKVHRDIKPGNIVRRRQDDSFVLLDPGIAFDQDGDSLTDLGLVPHSLGYLAPEHVNPLAKREADVRADFFLLGTVLYLAATGVHPFMPSPRTSAADALRNIIERNPRNPSELRHEIPDGLSEIIMRLLNKKKHLRFRDCDQLQESIRRLEEPSQ